MPKRFMFILLGRGSFLILHAQIVSSQADRQSGRAADYAHDGRMEEEDRTSSVDAAAAPKRRPALTTRLMALLSRGQILKPLTRPMWYRSVHLTTTGLSSRRPKPSPPG